MNEEIRISNVPSMTVGNIVDELAEAYSALINNNSPLKLMPSVMLWGSPGVGKSQGVRQIAERIEENTGRKVNVTDVRLLLFNPIDLRGIPTANEEKTLAVWLKPKIFQMDEGTDTVNILFLDEISAAPQSVQAAAYQITLDRTVGEHRLPDNCIVIAAGNRVTDKSVAYKMPKALANRLMHIDVEVSFDSWKKWAIGFGVNPMVLGYLSFRQDALINFQPASEELAFPTPRSWEMVSNILNNVNDDVDKVFNLISGIVGIGVAAEFHTWTKIYSKLPNVDDIFKGKAKVTDIPESNDVLYALEASMVGYAKKNMSDIKGITYSIRYAKGFKKEFQAILIKDYMYLGDDFKKKLLKIPEFISLANSNGSIMNGLV